MQSAFSMNNMQIICSLYVWKCISLKSQMLNQGRFNNNGSLMQNRTLSNRSSSAWKGSSRARLSKTAQLASQEIFEARSWPRLFPKSARSRAITLGHQLYFNQQRNTSNLLNSTVISGNKTHRDAYQFDWLRLDKKEIHVSTYFKWHNSNSSISLSVLPAVIREIGWVRGWRNRRHLDPRCRPLKWSNSNK